MVEKKLA